MTLPSLFKDLSATTVVILLSTAVGIIGGVL